MIGVATGTAATLVLSIGCWGRDFDGACAAVVAAGAGVGAGVGVAIDHARKGEGTVLFETAAPGSSGVVFSTAPLVSRGRKGLVFHVRW